MICSRLHSRAGQTPVPGWGGGGVYGGVRGGHSQPLPAAFSLLLLSLVPLGPECSADGPRPLEIHAAPACPQLAHGRASQGPFPDAVAKGEGGSPGLESAPTGSMGPLRAASGSGPLGTGPSRGEGAGQRGMAVGMGNS